MRSARRPTGSSYGQVWQYTIWRLSTSVARPGMPASSPAATATSSHMSRGSGASTGSGFTGRHVRWATPIRQGVRGSTGMWLLPLPDRRALFREGLGALLGVLGLEHLAADLLLELVGLLE